MSLPDPRSSDAAAALRAYLTDRDEACPSCSYNLRGLTSDCCPECNEVLVMRVNIAEPRLGAWIVTLAGLFACGGGALICLMLVMYMCFREGIPRGKDVFPIVVYPILVAAAAGSAAALLASPAGRRWFRGREGSARTAMAAGAWLTVVIAVVGFIAMVE